MIMSTKNVLTLQGPLTDQETQLIAFTGRENISEVYEYKIKFIYTGTKPLNAKTLIGQTLNITLHLPDQERLFNGIIANFNYINQKTEQYCELTIVPSLGLLKYHKTSRIFQQKTVKDIISQILNEYQVSFNFYQLTGTYPTLEYCVQYHETDLDFLHRLMAHYGLFYYFSHTAQQHKMIIMDNAQAYIPRDEPLAVNAPEGGYAQLNEWQACYAFYSGSFTYNDHDFTNPDKQLIVKSLAKQPIANNTQYEIYDHPGGYNDNSTGKTLSQLRLSVEENEALMINGRSTYTDLTLCQKISPQSSLLKNDNVSSFVITELTHHIKLDQSHPDHLIYHNTFRCMPADKSFRSPYSASKPLAPGVQLATVVGPQGSDIYTDQYGRLKVQFVWDREGTHNEKSSCWIRSLVQWEGILRVGTPVLVGFVDNDIDHPLILGPVMNANMMPLYQLTTQQTQSGIKRRHPDKSIEQTYNEIRFEDKLNQQQLYMFASKDMQTTVANNFQCDVQKGYYILNVTGDVTIKTQGNCSVTAEKDITLSAGQNLTLTAGQNISFQAGQNATTRAGLTIQHQAGTEVSQQALSISQQAGAKITTVAPLQNIQALGLLTLQAGLIMEN